MGTRGAVGIGTPENFRALYNHWDSYPTGLGAEVWAEVQRRKGDLHAFAKELLEYDDWRAYGNKGICQYCGKKTTQPHTLRILNEAADYKAALEGEKRGYAEIRVTDAAIESYWKSMSWAAAKPDAVQKNIDEEKAIIADFKRTGFPDPDVRLHEHHTEPVEELQFTPERTKGSWLEWVYLIDPKKRTFSTFVVSGDGLQLVGAPAHIDGPEPSWEDLEDAELEC